MQGADCAGYLRRAESNIHTQQSTYYFELRGCMLYYWETKPRGPGDIPIRGINIYNAVITDESQYLPYSWSVRTTQKQYIFLATSNEEKAAWIDKMKHLNMNNVSALQTDEAVSDEDEGTTLFPAQNQDKVSLSDFSVIAVLGKGSFGRVYQVVKKDTSESYAMKELNKSDIERENLIEHIFAEKSILQTIDHPFIVKLHYAFQSKERLYMILDLLAGGELFFHLGKVGTFDEARAKFYTAELGLAIGHLHSLNIIYRDLKPENAVLDAEGHVRLTDFGLAKMNVKDASASTFCGTPEYLAPEFLIGNTHGRAVDWWSLGIMLYEMLYGIPPFYNENQNLMYEMIIESPLTFPADPPVSEEGKDLLCRLIDRDPVARLQNVEEFKQHPFFNDIDFAKLFQREIPPPFIPDQNPINNFDDQFTTQSPTLPDEPSEDPTGEHATVAGFTYEGQIPMGGHGADTPAVQDQREQRSPSQLQSSCASRDSSMHSSHSAKGASPESMNKGTGLSDEHTQDGASRPTSAKQLPK